MSENSKRYVWTDEETKVFLDLIQEKNSKAMLDGKQQRNARIYQDLRRDMMHRGFDKPWSILRTKWKSLKQRYMGEKRAGGKNGRSFRFFDHMETILGQRPHVTSLCTRTRSPASQREPAKENQTPEPSEQSEPCEHAASPPRTRAGRARRLQAVQDVSGLDALHREMRFLRRSVGRMESRTLPLLRSISKSLERIADTMDYISAPATDGLSNSGTLRDTEDISNAAES